MNPQAVPFMTQQKTICNRAIAFALLAVCVVSARSQAGTMLSSGHSQNFVQDWQGVVHSIGSALSQSTSNPVYPLTGGVYDITVSANASSGGTASSLLRAGSSGISGLGDLSAGRYILPAVASAEAQWRDRITLKNTTVAPSFITVRLRLTGLLSAVEDQVDANFSHARARAWAGNGYQFSQFGRGTSTDLGYLEQHAKFGYFDSGFDSLDRQGTKFNGTFSARINFNPTTKDYAFHTGVRTYAYAHRGSALADFSNTLGIDAVFDDQGRQLTGADIQFASGIQFGSAAVPEPTSIVIFGLGGCTCLCIRRKHND